MFLSRRAFRRWPFSVAGFCVCIAGCGGDASNRVQLSSRYPPDRARAAVRAAQSGDLRAAHELVDLLEDDDRAVRMYAIASLERLTGKTYGYRYYADETDRTAALARWRAALRAGRFDDEPADSTATPAASARSQEAVGQAGQGVTP